MTKTNILLLGCGGNAGINFTKSIKLANQHINVYGIDIDPYNLISSNADYKFLLQNTHDTNTKINFINQIINEHNISALHAQPDKEVEFLCQNSHLLNCKIFNHSSIDLNKCKDKLYTGQVWKNYFNYKFDIYNLNKVIDNPILFNVLNDKNSKVWFRSKSGAGSKAALPVTDLETAICWANYWINKEKNLSLSDFILSTFLPGPEYAVQTFWLNGELIHSQARERIVYFFGNIMPSGQSSTPSVARSIKQQIVYDIAHQSVRLINDRPHGIYCVDLKTNLYNTIIPTEINYGRFFTTSDFFANIGVNTPYSYLQSILYPNQRQNILINTIQDEYFWIRGLDVEPTLIKSSSIPSV